MKNVKLKARGVFINEDFCPDFLDMKQKQFPLMKRAREEGKIEFFRHTKLIIRERTEKRTSVKPASLSPLEGLLAHSLVGDTTVSNAAFSSSAGGEASVGVSVTMTTISSSTASQPDDGAEAVSSGTRDASGKPDNARGQGRPPRKPRDSKK